MDFNPPQLSYLVSGYLLIEDHKQCQNVQDVKCDQKNKFKKIQANIDDHSGIVRHKWEWFILRPHKNDEQYTRPIYLIADLIIKVAHRG